MLQYAIIDEGERLPVSRRKQIDYAAIDSGLDTKFVFRPTTAFAFRPGNDVGFHAYRAIGVVGAFHRTPAIIPVRRIARHVHIDARPVN